MNQKLILICFKALMKKVDIFFSGIHSILLDLNRFSSIRKNYVKHRIISSFLRIQKRTIRRLKEDYNAIIEKIIKERNRGI